MVRDLRYDSDGRPLHWATSQAATWAETGFKVESVFTSTVLPDLQARLVRLNESSQQVLVDCARTDVEKRNEALRTQLEAFDKLIEATMDIREAFEEARKGRNIIRGAMGMSVPEQKRLDQLAKFLGRTNYI